MARNKDNAAGIASMASYPIVSYSGQYMAPNTYVANQSAYNQNYDPENNNVENYNEDTEYEDNND